MQVVHSFSTQVCLRLTLRRPNESTFQTCEARKPLLIPLQLEYSDDWDADVGAARLYCDPIMPK